MSRSFLAPVWEWKKPMRRTPGGAHAVMEHGGLEGVDRVLAVHCDPTVDVGTVGLRVGPITAASDSVHVVLTGRGGHTSRPHLTQDLTYALGTMLGYDMENVA